LSLAVIAKLAASPHFRYVGSAPLEEFDIQTRRHRALRTFFVFKRSKPLALRASSHIVRAQAEPKAQTHIRIHAICHWLL
jgi:hypothetical protein